MKGIGIVPARAGSKRLRNKNMMKINGVPLAMIAYDVLCMAGLDRVVVSTNIKKLYDMLNEDSRIWRKDSLCDDDTYVQAAVKWTYNVAGDFFDYDYIVMLMPNCPGITPKDVYRAIDLMTVNGLNIVRSYGSNGIENGLLVARRDYYMTHWVDTYVGGLTTKAMEIHDADDFNIAKEMFEIHRKGERWD